MIETKGFKYYLRIFLIYFIVIALGLLCLLPLWNMLMYSVSSASAITRNEVTLYPVDPTFMAYKYILKDAQFWSSFGRSVLRVVLGLVLNVSLSVLMAYPLSKSVKEFRARDTYMGILLFAMLFSGGLVPTFILVKKLKLLNTIWALVLPGAVPIFSVIMVMNFFKGVPKSLEEAAILDGATPLQVLTQVYVPCAKPSIATISLFSIVGHWNDFFGGLVYNTKTKFYPLMTYIYSLQVDMQKLAHDGASAEELAEAYKVSGMNLNAAKIVVAVVPLLLIYPLLQKYLITGIVIGAVKE